MIDGDDIMAIAAQDMLAQGSLANKTVVTTVMSNAGLDAFIGKLGGKTIRTPVGDRHVIDEMLKHGLQFRRRAERAHDFPGLQQHRRRIGVRAADFADHESDRKAALEAGALLDAVSATGDQRARAGKEAVRETGRRACNWWRRRRRRCKPGGGRVLLRYSGTEPKARLLIEGKDNAVLELHSKKICDAIKKQVGE